MKIILKSAVFTAMLFVSTFVFSQTDTLRLSGDTLRTLGDTVDVRDNNAIEMLLENQTDDSEDSKLLETLQQLEANPIDLNSANSGELQRVPYIDAIISSRIIAYRVKNQKFYSIAELRSVEGIDDDLYGKIKKFVMVKNSTVDFIRDEFGIVNTSRNSRSSFFRNLRLEFRTRLSNDLQPSRGYLDTTYLGSRPKFYNRLLAKYTTGGYTFTGSLLTEKDPGEKSLTDHVGGFFEMKSPLILNQVLAGDYTLEFGQGITLWGSYSFSKGNDAVSGIKKKGDDIDSYNSVNEVQYFRGVAGKLKLGTSVGDLSLFGFYSDNYIDASIDTTLNMLSSSYEDGNHRTESEINRRNSGKEKLLGGRLFYESKILGTTKIGLTYYKSEYNKPFEYKGLYDFSGTTSNALGVDYDIVYKNINIFGEWARSYTDKVGGVTGVKFLFFKLADVIFMVRNYPKDFIMLHSYGFGEQSGTSQNEFGIYSGIRFKIGKLAVVNAYFDQYKFPYATFYNPVPTTGNDFLTYTEWNVTRNLKLFTKYKNETKEDVIKVTNQYGIEEEKIYDRGQRNYRIQFDYDMFKKLRVRSRFEYVFVDYAGYQTSQKGMLFFSDFRATVFNNLVLDGRFVIFQTDSFDSRIYEYENEISGVVSNQGMYGKGRRWYLLLKYRPYKFLELSAKYAETVIEGAKSIGSGNDEVMGDLKNRFTLQLELKF
ncbi:MAG: helix-hairpin-helix domain-containing protein [Ignavibacteria bacterium]|nr:helix-hairpin-helix domain-containing protein [Ignavibacteria bacterium]